MIYGVSSEMFACALVLIGYRPVSVDGWIIDQWFRSPPQQLLDWDTTAANDEGFNIIWRPNATHSFSLNQAAS